MMTIDDVLKIVADGDPVSRDVALDHFFRISYECIRLRAELAQERKRLEWALTHYACFEDGQFSFECGDKYEPVVDVVNTTNPRSTIDELMGDAP